MIITENKQKNTSVETSTFYKVIVELKCVENLREEHKAQLINYLKATDVEVGLLFNFGKKADIKRAIFSNNRKKSV
jgi:GxxExxY protein